MAQTTWLIDTSAVARVGVSLDAADWANRIQRGLVRVASVTRIELGYSARSAIELRGERRGGALSLMPVEYLTPSTENRAEQIQELLADRGMHRAPSHVDLFVAAIAERAGLTVLHVDKDFDLIAEVTGQPVERLRLPDEES